MSERCPAHAAAGAGAAHGCVELQQLSGVGVGVGVGAGAGGRLGGLASLKVSRAPTEDFVPGLVHGLLVDAPRVEQLLDVGRVGAVQEGFLLELVAPALRSSGQHRQWKVVSSFAADCTTHSTLCSPMAPAGWPAACCPPPLGG